MLLALQRGQMQVRFLDNNCVTGSHNARGTTGIGIYYLVHKGPGIKICECFGLADG